MQFTRTVTSMNKEVAPIRESDESGKLFDYKELITKNEVLYKLAQKEGFTNCEEMDARDLFEAIFKKYVKREGADQLLAYIQSTDFFKAPASTRFHGSYEGGLVEHSLHVYECYKRIVEHYSSIYGVQMSEDSIALVSLLHDLCKAGVYKIEMRNKKIDGVWQQVPVYTFDDDMPLGHGQKSAFLVMQYCHLTPIEFACIAFHMGAFDAGNNPHNVGDAFNGYPEAFLLSMADSEATYFVENEKWQKRVNQ